MSINPSDLRRAAQGNRVLSVVIGVLLAGGLVLLLLWNAILVRIPPGRVGTLFSLFSGTVEDAVYPEGLAIKLPWNQMYIFDARWQAVPFHVDAFSQEGMPIKVDATIVFRLRRPQIPRVLVDLGTDYVEQFVNPIATGAVLRELGPGFASGHLKPFPIKPGAIYPLEQAKAAFIAVAGSSRDRVILRP